jgi:hypothetical protein
MIQYQPTEAPESSSRLLWLVSVALVAPAALIVLTLNLDLALIAFSVLLFAGAAVAATFAFVFRTKPRAPDLNLWDIAGGLALTGCAASIFGEPEHVALLFEHLFERRTAAQ